MRGFQLCAPAWQLSEALVATWVRMHEHGILDDPADGDAHSLKGVASFLMQAMRFRKDLNMKATRAMRRAVGCASLNVLSWLAARVDSYVMRIYCQYDDSVRRAPPAL